MHHKSILILSFDSETMLEAQKSHSKISDIITMYISMDWELEVVASK